jgi:hypothetical protein
LLTVSIVTAAVILHFVSSHSDHHTSSAIVGQRLLHPSISIGPTIMRSISVCLYLLFAKIALVAAQQSNSTGNGTVSVPTPTLSPTITRPPFTWEPTTTFPPTMTPTRAPIPAPVPDRSCYTNLTEIDDKNKLKNPFVVETFVLCPNTVFKMGVYGPDGDIVDGYNPLQPRSNTIYTCGEDGKSSNNCTLDGGGYHIYHSFVTYNRENKVGVVLKGITFNDSIEGGVILVAPGDITFIDCIFSVRLLPLFCSRVSHFTDGIVSLNAEP